MSYSVGQLHKYAVNLYKTLEEETGKNVGLVLYQILDLVQKIEWMSIINMQELLKQLV